MVWCMGQLGRWIRMSYFRAGTPKETVQTVGVETRSSWGLAQRCFRVDDAKVARFAGHTWTSHFVCSVRIASGNQLARFDFVLMNLPGIMQLCDGLLLHHLNTQVAHMTHIVCFKAVLHPCSSNHWHGFGRFPSDPRMYNPLFHI